jgi:NAD+ synthase (glutamine-hydrolysing)
MKIAIAQLNPTIGDLSGNSNLIREAAKQATVEGANLLLTPELSLLGYPPRDLLMNPSFIAIAAAHLVQLCHRSWQSLSALPYLMLMLLN